jgi:2-polyprenyl-3-methyl-5-hydroxy-6-metoxy-1,4-benzoquinol methylase
VAKDGWNTTGIEPSDRAKLLLLVKEFHLSIIRQSRSSFDVITMWHVLEHVPDLDFQIKELKRLLKPTGTLIVAVPNFKSFDAKHYGAFWAAYDVPIHFGISLKTIKLLLREEISLKKKFSL